MYLGHFLSSEKQSKEQEVVASGRFSDEIVPAECGGGGAVWPVLQSPSENYTLFH